MLVSKLLACAHLSADERGLMLAELRPINNFGRSVRNRRAYPLNQVPMFGPITLRWLAEIR